MPLVWLRPESGGAWSHFSSVADTVKHLNTNGVELFATQVSRSASKAATRNGWCFCSSPPRARMTPHLPKGRMRHRQFPPHVPCKQDYQPSSLQVLSCPLLGVARRSSWGTSLCAQVATNMFIPFAKKGPNASDVFAGCVTRRQGILCGPASPVCIRCMMHAPSPCLIGSNGYARLASQSPRNQLHRQKRHFNPQWQVGRPWLRFGNGVTWCVACKEYPQPGMHQAWIVGTTAPAGVPGILNF